MKNFNFLKVCLLLALSSFAILGCDDSDDGQVAYDGTNLLNFSSSTADVFVVEGTGETIFDVKYGLLKKSAGSHSVKLVPDVAASTAVLNVDYELITDTDVINDGEGSGAFKVKFFESPATLAGKIVVFKLQSSTLSSAVFNYDLTVSVKLTCPVPSTMFLGNYLIQELTPFVDGPTLSNGTVVVVTAITGSPNGRTFLTQNYPNYCAPFRAFEFDLVCGAVVARSNQRSTCQCSTAGMFFGPAIVNSTFNVANDSYFELTFTNDVTGNCGSAVQTTYSFTKQ